MEFVWENTVVALLIFALVIYILWSIFFRKKRHSGQIAANP